MSLFTFTDPSPVVVGQATKKSFWDKLFDNTFALRDANKRWVDTPATPVGNVGGGTDDLISRTLAANVLNANGDGLRITQWGDYLNSSNATFKSLFGGTAINLNEASDSVVFSEVTGTTRNWKLVYEIFKTGTGAQMYNSLLLFPGGTSTRLSFAGAGTLAIDMTAPIIVKCTANSSTSTTDAIRQKGMLIETLNNV